jgi:putative transposase
MKLVFPVKLNTTQLQFQALYETLYKANEAANFISAKAWVTKTFRQFDLHKLVYTDVRTKFGLGSQITIRTIAKVAHAYQLNHKIERKFCLTGAVSFDARNLKVYNKLNYVTISTLLGRIKIPFITGKHQAKYLHYKLGESNLILKDKTFYLYLTYDVPEEPLIESEIVLGVDLGIVNIATTSDGTNYSGAEVNSLRKRHRRLRAKLQSKGTKSAKRLLKKRRKKEQRFNCNTNHIISKRIVEHAKCTKQFIALENLKGIKLRTKVRKAQRAILHGWSFYQLSQFIQYKAKLKGISVVLVDPRNTSRECPKCHNIDKKNRKTRDYFECSCGFAGPADYIAAINISRRGAVNHPHAA